MKNLLWKSCAHIQGINSWALTLPTAVIHGRLFYFSLRISSFTYSPSCSRFPSPFIRNNRVLFRYIKSSDYTKCEVDPVTFWNPYWLRGFNTAFTLPAACHTRKGIGTHFPSLTPDSQMKYTPFTYHQVKGKKRQNRKNSACDPPLTFTADSLFK